jgi:hypothetical protein
MVNGESAFWSLLGQIELAESAREASAGTRPPPALSERLSLERQAGGLTTRSAGAGARSLEKRAGRCTRRVDRTASRLTAEQLSSIRERIRIAVGAA